MGSFLKPIGNAMTLPMLQLRLVLGSMDCAEGQRRGFTTSLLSLWVGFGSVFGFMGSALLIGRGLTTAGSKRLGLEWVMHSR